MSMSEKIKLQGSDGDVFTIEAVAISKASTVIKIMLENIEAESEAEVIILKGVTGAILKKVIEWVDHYKDFKDGRPSKLKDEDREWERNFFGPRETTFDLVRAADYLGVKGLLDAGCKAVAEMMKSLSPEQLRQEFKIKNDFEPGEEARILAENQMY